MKVLQTMVGAARALWMRFDRFLTVMADRQVNGWAGAMEYKRSYTNPDVAKRSRQSV